MWKYIKDIFNRLQQLLFKGKAAGQSTFIRVAYCVPRQIVLLTARHNNSENVWPIDWHIPVSIKPELYAVSLNRGYGEELIRASGVFVVNFVPSDWEQAIFYCGKTSGRDEDKFATSGLKKSEASMINAPCLTEALGTLECKVLNQIVAGDHVLYIAEVVHATRNLDAKRLHHLDNSMADMTDNFE
jgi:flavin reductase (DIM6/NTAB) family NADH-FMN oxidoreductase RutF